MPRKVVAGKGVRRIAVAMSGAEIKVIDEAVRRLAEQRPGERVTRSDVLRMAALALAEEISRGRVTR
jgi:hypothetical protein